MVDREIARGYGIPHNHLMKVVHDLRKDGFVHATRGRSGGIRLARPAREITVSEVVRRTEKGFERVGPGFEALAPGDSLQGLYDEALRAFMTTLDGRTLADLIEPAVN